MSINYGYQPIVTNGLVLHLDAANPNSYRSGSTTWNDLSGNRNNGTLVNGPGYNSANFGSITFDGVDDYVDCGNASSLSITSAITLICWFKLNAAPSISGNPNLIDKWDWPNNLRVYFLGTEGGVFSTSISRDGTFGNRLVVLDSIAPTIGQYYFLCATYNGQTLNFYKNNNLVGSTSYGTSYSIFSSQSTQTWIGRTRDAGQGGRWISANIYSTQIYNRALSATEVFQNYNALKSRYGL